MYISISQRSIPYALSRFFLSRCARSRYVLLHYAILTALLCLLPYSRAQYDYSQLWHGELGETSATLPSGEFHDVIRVSAEAGERWFLYLGSKEFDAYLIVRGPEGNRLAEVDDSAAFTGTDAFAVLVTPLTGEYSITVTTVFPGEKGHYQLYLQRGVTIPATYQSKLEPDSFMLARLGISNVYVLAGRAGARVYLAADSHEPSLDTRLFIYAPDGSVESADDNVGLNPRLHYTFPTDGYYPLFINAFDDTGRYRLRIEPQPPARDIQEDIVESEADASESEASPEHSEDRNQDNSQEDDSHQGEDGRGQ